MAKRRNPKPKNVTELVEVKQPALSLDMPIQSEPVTAMEDQAPVPTAAIPGLPAIGDVPALAAETPAPAEPAVAAETEAAPAALAAGEQPIDAAVIAIEAE